VASPLTWRVLVSVTARARDVTDLRGTTFGITRAGGGAHTTLLLLAADMGWRAGVDVAVTPLGSLDALLRATGNGAIDAFLWEALTIKPWLDDGTIRSIGVVVPPWPGFSVAARTETTTRRPDAVRAVLHVLRHAAAIAAAEPDETAALITQRYGLSPRDAADWLVQVRYADDGALSRRAIETMVAVLRRTGAIVDAAPVEDIVDRQFAPLLD
jgi:ABC-type nitrate/sulfonate/bicarbonate transport system substrate-binding protein